MFPRVIQNWLQVFNIFAHSSNNNNKNSNNNNYGKIDSDDDDHDGDGYHNINDDIERSISRFFTIYSLGCQLSSTCKLCVRVCVCVCVCMCAYACTHECPKSIHWFHDLETEVKF